jgi:hypothetical protein
MQPQTQSVLESLQWEVQDALARVNPLRSLPIHTHSQSWFEAQIRCQTEMTSGIHIRIHPPIPLRLEEGISGPIFDDLELCIEVLEYPINNTSGWSIVAVAEQICRQLHGLVLQPPSGSGQLSCRPERPWHYQFEDACNRIQIYFTAAYTL